MHKTILKSCKSWAVICLTLIVAASSWAQESDSVIKMTAAQYIGVKEISLKHSTDLREQLRLLEPLAVAALAAGETEKAQNYARELLTVATKKLELSKSKRTFTGWDKMDYGFAIHFSNIVLGRVAFQSGDIDKAKEHLLAAGQVTGNPPTLVSFGPDMLLAKLLIEKGERETAIQYFDLCAKFWIGKDEKLEQWKNIVKKGKMPDFGYNLKIIFDRWRLAHNS